MRPSSRKRKVGLKRIDAALDAVRPMGFSDSLIRKTVKTLLEAYGGDDGWPFIEEGSYQLLVDSMIEELESGKDEPKALAGGETKLLTNELSEEHPLTPLDIVPCPVEDVGLDEKIEMENHPPLPETPTSSQWSFCSPPPVDSLPFRRRKPCYGWICSDDDEEPELVRFDGAASYIVNIGNNGFSTRLE